MRRETRTLAVALCLLTGAVACSRWQKKARGRGELTDAERAAIAAYSSGTISRESPIRVVFAADVAAAGELLAPLASSPFAFEPAIKGVAVWSGPSQIEFRPADRLPDGQAYKASLDIRALGKPKLTLPRFEFEFAAMKQSFEVSLDGLEATSAADIKAQKLTGKLLTADVEDAARVEKLLSAAHLQDEL